MASTTPDSIDRARRILAAHGQVDDVGEPYDCNGGVAIDIHIRVNLPSRLVPEGRSRNGVLVREPVRVFFPKAYPRRAPKFYARNDFDRRLPHILPGPSTGPVQPCIFEGNTTELFHMAGLSSLIDHLVAWYDKAALGNLIDPEQGWEPVRRDSLSNQIVADLDHIHSLLTNKGGHAFLGFRYLASDLSCYGEVTNNRLAAARHFGQISEKEVAADRRIGHTVAVIVWAGKGADGKPLAINHYEPETVVDLATLRERAKLYGCDKDLNAAFGFINGFVGKPDRTFVIAVMLCVRRPVHMIGSSSSIEVCPYIVRIQVPDPLSNGASTSVAPAGHEDALTPDLLKRMSGDTANAAKTSVALLGAGSLGSKIAIHLARRGAAPEIVIDNAMFGPRHAARHALIPPQTSQLFWDYKADALADGIRRLGQESHALRNDVVTAMSEPKSFAALIEPAKFLLNTTGTATVSESLASIGAIAARIIDASLMNNGRMGIISLEGPARNPDIGDLMTDGFRLLSQEELAGGDPISPISIGQGCSSLTITMPDSRISAFAAPMSDVVMKWTRDSSGTGELMIGRVADDGISLLWERYEVAPVRVVPIDDSSMVIRLSERARLDIEADMARWPCVETGGVLMGRYSEAARAFYVSDVLEAPPDSLRKASEFVLGVTGLRARIDEYLIRYHGALYCLGTWHRHLLPQHASSIDRNTATILASARITPQVMLIHAANGYNAILAT